MLGIDLWDAGLMPAMFVALLGGLISFASPCVLPIVPPYLAYMGGVSMDDMSATAQARRRVVLAALFFVLGLSTVFILLGFTASSFGRLFLSNQDWFVSGAGILVMVFGAHFLGVIRMEFWTAKRGLRGATAVVRPLVPIFWGWPSPLAGRLVWGPFWAQSSRLPPIRPIPPKGSSCSPPMRRALGYPLCWWRCSSRLSKV